MVVRDFGSAPYRYWYRLQISIRCNNEEEKLKLKPYKVYVCTHAVHRAEMVHGAMKPFDVDLIEPLGVGIADGCIDAYGETSGLAIVGKHEQIPGHGEYIIINWIDIRMHALQLRYI